MASFKDKKVLKLLMGLCLVMQALFLLPHHHHGGDEVPCLDVMHCLEAGSDARGDSPAEDGKHGSSGEHSHDSEGKKCSMNDIEQLRIDSDSLRGASQNGASAMSLAVFTVGSDDDACGHCHLDSVLDLSIRRNRGIPSVHIAYIAQALPPRAPSFTV